MAKNRMLSTGFWNDGYSSNLDPVEKLLFIYLLTNERSTLAGIYELPIKIMAVETGIENEMVKKILGRFEDDGKIMVKDGWVAIRNFAKHHPAGSPTVQKGIEDAISVSPDWAKGYIKGIDTISPSASASASASLHGDDPVEVREDDLEERPKTDTRRVQDKLSVYHLFSKREQPWWRFKMEREAALSLFDLVGIESIQRGLAVMREHADDRYCPQAATPREYAEQREKLKRYMKRNGI